MFPLPQAPADIIHKWQGTRLKGVDQLTGYVIVWCGVPFRGKLTRDSVKPEHVFVLKQGDQFKYALHDDNGFFELYEKWYSKCFGRVENIPTNNTITMCIGGSYIDLPFLPPPLFNRRVSTKRRKKSHRIDYKNVYPTWKHVQGEGVHFEVAKQFRDIFNRADAGEITLRDPFEGYASMDEIKRSKTGKLAFQTVAGFVYYHCRDNLGYPINL